MVEAPVDQQSIQSVLPFQSIVPIHLSVAPPAHCYSEQPEFYHIELCKKFDFVIDIERDAGLNLIYSFQSRPYSHTQLVHRSGVAFIQIQGNSFVFLNNLLHLANQNLRNTACPDPNLLRRTMAKFCQDAVELETFWELSKKKLDGLMTVGSNNNNL